MMPIDELSRRELMRLGAAAGAGGLLLPEVAPAAIAGGTARLTGRVVRPRDPGYEAARIGWDRLFSHYPLAIAFCRSGRDAANALAWARRQDVAFRVRSGRHHLEGWSSLDGGLVIDVSQAKGVRLDAKARTVTVGAGLTQGELVAALGRRGFAVPTGSEASVGVAGATLGGGFGFLTRAFGLTCDSLLGARLAVPAGRRGAKLVSVDLRRRPDLLWACRGGGGGNFGIATSFTLRVHPLGEVAFVTATWPGFADLAAVFDAWQRTVPVADRRLTSALEVAPDAIKMFAVLASGSTGEARRILEPLLAIGAPEVSARAVSWPDLYADLNSGPRRFANWKFYSQFVARPFPRTAIEIVRRYMERAPSPPSNFFCSSFGGAVRREPRGGSAFSHRDALFYAEPGAGWNGDEPTADCQGWVAQFGRALRRYVSGAYVSVPNAGVSDWGNAYYGRNYRRLRKIKAKYDPHDVFRFEQSIPPSDPSR